MKKAAALGIGLVFLLALGLLAETGSARVGGGDIKYPSKDAGDSLFSHEVHVAKAGGSCRACHPDFYVTREKAKPVTMEQMQKGQSCGACHDGKKAFTVKESCERCHHK